MPGSVVYLIPTVLAEDGYATIPSYVATAIRNCQVIFTENERTTRRYFKSLWKEQRPGEEIVIDHYEWFVIDEHAAPAFRENILKGKTIGILSEAGCPGVADPGQALIQIAQELGAEIKPLTGPNSILLALMASGMNGQQFRFVGYLPIDAQERIHAIRELENESAKKNCTQIFIETPYRNNQLIEAVLKTCSPNTRLCIAVDITGAQEKIITRTIAAWKKDVPNIHKRPAIFLLYSGA